MSTTIASDRTCTLAPWVERHEERCRRGRRYILLVNRRDGHAIQLTPDEAALCDRLGGADPQLADDPAAAAMLTELASGGFLADTDVEAGDAPARTSFLRSLDARWNGADRFVRALYRRGLRHAFHPAALAAQLVLAVAGVVALASTLGSGQPFELRAVAWHIPILIAIGLVAVAVHELAHALVVVHYGRSVQAIGFRLHLGTPSFYVESVDALLLTRRQRMLQAAAGPWAEWLFTSIVAIALLHSPPALLVPILVRFVVLNTATIASNLLPFVGLDGYWLLADGLREPDLGRRSHAAVPRIVAGLTERRAPTLEDFGLGAYAVTNTVVAAGLVAIAGFFWYQLFAEVIAALLGAGPLGWMALAGVVSVLFRPVAGLARAHGRGAFEFATRTVTRARFRLEWRWRIPATRELAADPALAGLDGRALGIVAGQLRRVRTTFAPGEADGVVTVRLPSARLRRPLLVVLDRRAIELARSRA